MAADRPVTGDGSRPVAGSIVVAGLHHRYDEAEVLLDVGLEIEAGTTIALLGPSGCGKTTLLRAIAGLERPHRGTITIDGDPVLDQTTWVPPERRQVGFVFQDWALFPHRTVAGNVGYGLPRRGRRARVAEALQLVGLDGFDDRLPSTLSGGQQQRVALARALAPRPRVLLLDEPFSSLDASRRVEVRADLRDLLDRIGTTAVFVTHDQEEAFVLGDRVALMHEGRIVQVDRPEDLYRRPADRWAAEFVGEAVVLDGEAHGEVATTMIGHLRLDRSLDGPVEVLVRPEQLRLTDRPGGGGGGDDSDDGAEVGVDGEIVAVEYHGHDAMVVVRLDTATTVRVRTGPTPIGRPGDAVGVVFGGERATAFARVDVGADH